MLSAQRAAPQRQLTAFCTISRSGLLIRPCTTKHPIVALHLHPHAQSTQITRSFSYTLQQKNDNRTPSLSSAKTEKVEAVAASGKDVEKTVRDAKQRFRDTLPKGYLKPDEYELYVRLYGPPLRETTPDDVGIPSHDNYEALDAPIPGPYEMYNTQATEVREDGHQQSYPAERHEDRKHESNYVEIVARNQREYDALKKLELDFKAAKELADKEAAEIKIQETEERIAEEQRSSEEVDEEGAAQETEERHEDEEWDCELPDPLANSRLHPLTQDARFGISPSTVYLPADRLVSHTTDILKRIAPSHIKLAAERLFGGPGLPHGPVTPQRMKTVEMKAIPIQMQHRRMQPIDADAVMAAYVPPVYASILGVLVELRKRLGSSWIRGLMEKNGDEGPRVLDVGGAGAGIIAWEQILGTEWQVLHEKGEVPKDSRPITRKSVVAGSEALRDRLSKFMYNTSFLPRMPDYVHSAENADRVLDGPEKPQTRKRYDVVLASHQLLHVEEGHKRRAVVNQLWSLLNPDGGVLVIIEKAHPRGFEAVADARQRFISEFLQTPGAKPQEEDISDSFTRIKEPGMVVAPCTNQRRCPLYLVEGKSLGRKDFCFFAQRYIRPPYLQRIMQAKHRNSDDVEFSYVAIQRGTMGPPGLEQNAKSAGRAFTGYEKDATDYHALALPRNIRPPLKKHGHVSMDLCTPEGNFERWTVSKSFSKTAYHDARKIRWGDLWALGAKTRTENRVRMGRGDVVKDGGVKGHQARADETRSSSKRPEVVNLQMNALGKAVPMQKPMKGYHHTKGGRHMAKAQASKGIREVERELDRVLHDGAVKADMSKQKEEAAVEQGVQKEHGARGSGDHGE
ncbi:37S ribosomal protein S22 [Ceratocystis pirilliformis]|uniref:37S ribosomal protein S22 n=1 Tax=Ceratocystis pirilliformis TaxID=259994 RepID=A0ABR3ZNP7_9PEZI